MTWPSVQVRIGVEAEDERVIGHLLHQRVHRVQHRQRR
jgi:hypothetical protein